MKLAVTGNINYPQLKTCLDSGGQRSRS